MHKELIPETRSHSSGCDVEENGFYSLFFASGCDEPICNDGLRERVRAMFGESHQVRTEKRA